MFARLSVGQRLLAAFLLMSLLAGVVGDSRSANYFAAHLLPQANRLDAPMREMSALKEREARVASEDATALFGVSRLQVAGFMLGAVLAGLVLGQLVRRSITGPLLRAVTIAETVAAGDLRSDIDGSAGDELGKLLRALAEMNSNLVTVVSQVRQGTDGIAVVSGQMDQVTQLNAALEEEAAASDALQTQAATLARLVSVFKLPEDVRSPGPCAPRAGGQF